MIQIPFKCFIEEWKPVKAPTAKNNFAKLNSYIFDALDRDYNFGAFQNLTIWSVIESPYGTPPTNLIAVNYKDSNPLGYIITNRPYEYNDIQKFFVVV